MLSPPAEVLCFGAEPQKKGGGSGGGSPTIEGENAYIVSFVAEGQVRLVVSVELSRSLKVSNRGANAPKSIQHRSASICTGLWAPPRAFWALVRPVWGTDLGPKSMIFDRILKNFPGPF